MSAIGAIASGATIVGRQTVGTAGNGDELVQTTVQMRVRETAAFGPAVQIAGSERFAGMAYQTGADDDPTQVSGGERSQLDQLRIRDGQVRQEEQAHAAAAGDMAGAIQYTYTNGPDGKTYVTGGYVPIRPTAATDDTAAASVAARLNATAHAATNPSVADLAVAKRGYEIAGSATGDVESREVRMA